MTNDPAPKLDRRVVRTRQLLRDALMSLILERGYDAVTVQDITDRANLGRATFYLHYRDKEDLLIKSLEAIYDDLVRATEQNQQPHRMIIFQHAAEHKTLYQVMLGSQAAGSITRRIREYLVGVTRHRILALNSGDALSIPVEILAEHMVGSMMALTTWWLTNDLPYSAEYMASVYQQLHIAALSAHFKAKPESS